MYINLFGHSRFYLSKCQSSSILVVTDLIHTYVDGETNLFLLFLISSGFYIVIIITPAGESISKCDLLSHSYKDTKG